MTITVAVADKLLIDVSNGLYTNDLSARSARESLLKYTDVWALSDRTMTAEQIAYRQALRDITGQAGFPTDITWPTKPE